MPGDMVLPVRAARRGWATWPSLRPCASAKARRAVSRAAGEKSVLPSWGARAVSMDWFSGVRRGGGFGFEGVWEVDEERRAFSEFGNGLRPLFEAGHEAQDAGACGFAIQPGLVQAGDDVVGQAGVVGGAEVDAVDLEELDAVEAAGGAADAGHVEQLDDAVAGDDLGVAVRPAEAEQVVAEGFGEVALLAVFVDADGAVALGHLGRRLRRG